MNRVIRVDSFPANEIDNKQYTASLLSIANRDGYISSKELAVIQGQLMDLSRDIINRYNKGNSTSITLEATQKLITSILYTLDMYMASIERPMDALENLISKGLVWCYDRGVEKLDECYDETRHLFRHLCNNRLDVGVEPYEQTIEGLAIFFKKYEKIFGAHNSMASIDYPLANGIDDIEIRGVLFMKAYMEHLILEDSFCKYYESQEVVSLLTSFGRMARVDYRIELLNIYELVFNNAIFSIISGGKSGSIRISEEERSIVESRLYNTPLDRIGWLIEKAFERLLIALGISDENLIVYAERYLPTLETRLKNAISNESLDSMIIVYEDGSGKGDMITFLESDGMTNTEYNMILVDISDCTDYESRVSLIRDRVLSLHDMIDILSSGILYEEDYLGLYKILGDMENSILSRIVFDEELREGSRLVAAIDTDRHLGEEWREVYRQHLGSMDLDRIEVIETLFDRIDYSVISHY